MEMWRKCQVCGNALGNHKSETYECPRTETGGYVTGYRITKFIDLQGNNADLLKLKDMNQKITTLLDKISTFYMCKQLAH